MSVSFVRLTTVCQSRPVSGRRLDFEYEAQGKARHHDEPLPLLSVKG